MQLNRIHDLIPFRKLFKLLLAISVSIQLIIISYSHYIGFYHVQGLLDFLSRFTIGSFLSLIAAFLIAYPDLLVIKFLEQKFNWERDLLKRLSIQFIFTIVIAIVVSSIITTLSNFIRPYQEGFINVLSLNALIFSVFNILMMIFLEAWIFYIEGAESKRKSESLEKELSEIKYEVLKNQLNPHFLFNSLNVLSGLIARDTSKSQLFIDEFANIYRYILESIEKQVVTVKQELDFAKSYIFLQRIRYGEFVNLDIELSANVLESGLPPLTLQLVLENAIKHNRISKDKPLTITIRDFEDRIEVTNNLQTKIYRDTSTGLGQSNLTKRYKLISNDLPEFYIVNSTYKVILPLIKEE